MKRIFGISLAILGAMILTACGSTEHHSKVKDYEGGSDCTDLYRYSTDSSPGFRVQDLPATIPGLVRDDAGLWWRQPGRVIKSVLPMYLPPAPGYVFQGQNLTLNAGGNVRFEVDFEAFESNIRWELVSNGNVLTTETVRYEANSPISGTYYSKPVAVGGGLSGLEARAWAADFKPNGQPAHVQLAWVPSVRIKQIRIYHTAPSDRVNAGDPSCRI